MRTVLPEYLRSGGSAKHEAAHKPIHLSTVDSACQGMTNQQCKRYIGCKEGGELTGLLSFQGFRMCLNSMLGMSLTKCHCTCTWQLPCASCLFSCWSCTNNPHLNQHCNAVHVAQLIDWIRLKSNHHYTEISCSAIRRVSVSRSSTRTHKRTSDGVCPGQWHEINSATPQKCPLPLTEKNK